MFCKSIEQIKIHHLLLWCDQVKQLFTISVILYTLKKGFVSRPCIIMSLVFLYTQKSTQKYEYFSIVLEYFYEYFHFKSTLVLSTDEYLKVCTWVQWVQVHEYIGPNPGMNANLSYFQSSDSSVNWFLDQTISWLITRLNV